VRFLLERQQQADGSMPRNSLLNGRTAPDSFGTQLDETAYPILMAWQAGLTDAGTWNHVRAAADFVVAHGPAFGVERWEEQSGFSPSTIAAEIAGLLAGAAIADANGARPRPGSTAPPPTTCSAGQGVDGDHERTARAHPYFIRLSKTGTRTPPSATTSATVAHPRPAERDRRRLPRADPARRAAPDDTDVVASLPVVDATIATDTANGPGWHRYNGDGYGDRAADGRPWAPTGQGTGHLWPVLSGERGEHDLQVGDRHRERPLLLGWRGSPRAWTSSPSRTGSCPTWPLARSGPTRRSRRSASATAARPDRPRP
jgi:hypothetical protein